MNYKLRNAIESFSNDKASWEEIKYQLTLQHINQYSSQSGNALNCAIFNDKPELVEYFLSIPEIALEKTHINQTPLMCAVRSPVMTRLLLRAGADVNAQTPNKKDALMHALDYPESFVEILKYNPNLYHTDFNHKSVFHLLFENGDKNNLLPILIFSTKTLSELDSFEKTRKELLNSNPNSNELGVLIKAGDTIEKSKIRFMFEDTEIDKIKKLKL